MAKQNPEVSLRETSPRETPYRDPYEGDQEDCGEGLAAAVLMIAFIAVQIHDQTRDALATGKHAAIQAWDDGVNRLRDLLDRN